MVDYCYILFFSGSLTEYWVFSFECNDSLRAVEGNIVDYGLVPYFVEQILYVLEMFAYRSKMMTMTETYKE